MALTNFVLTVAAVGAAALLFTTDIRKSGAMFRRNARQIRAWLEEESASAASRQSLIHGRNCSVGGFEV
ncbi:hypothetical protein DAI22_03g327000 [Oryza sativa Japonica Group]|nr:hypothetical protein DAI22_03g327000 [Oryza sativa Japonica Group]